MSKGPGKWQVAILAKLKVRDRFTLQELLGPSFTRAQYNALHRAMLKLEDAGRINVTRFCTFSGVRSSFVHRKGTTMSAEDANRHKKEKGLL